MATVVSRTVIPGFGLTLGFSVFYLSLLFLLPVAGLLIFTLQMSWADFWRAISHPQGNRFALLLHEGLGGVFNGTAVPNDGLIGKTKTHHLGAIATTHADAEDIGDLMGDINASGIGGAVGEKALFDH